MEEYSLYLLQLSLHITPPPSPKPILLQVKLPSGNLFL